MGACPFLVEWTGSDYRDGFRELVREAEYEYGTDPYNGSISTCSLHRGAPTRISDRYNKTAEKKALKYLEEKDDGVKWYAKVLDLGVVDYQIVSYKKRPGKKAEARWETFYVVYEDVKRLKSFKTLAEANRYLKTVVAKADGSADEYRIEKQSLNIGGNTTAAAYEWSCRTTKTKPKRIPQGAVLRERHKFFYYGWASC